MWGIWQCNTANENSDLREHINIIVFIRKMNVHIFNYQIYLELYILRALYQYFIRVKYLGNHIIIASQVIIISCNSNIWILLLYLYQYSLVKCHYQLIIHSTKLWFNSLIHYFPRLSNFPHNNNRVPRLSLPIRAIGKFT